MNDRAAEFWNCWGGTECQGTSWEIFLNPKRHWNFKGEDFVGRISRMAHSISFGVSSTRVSSKLHQIQVVLPFPVDQEHGGTCVGQ